MPNLIASADQVWFSESLKMTPASARQARLKSQLLSRFENGAWTFGSERKFRLGCLKNLNGWKKSAHYTVEVGSVNKVFAWREFLCWFVLLRGSSFCAWRKANHETTRINTKAVHQHKHNHRPFAFGLLNSAVVHCPYGKESCPLDQTWSLRNRCRHQKARWKRARRCGVRTLPLSRWLGEVWRKRQRGAASPKSWQPCR